MTIPAAIPKTGVALTETGVNIVVDATLVETVFRVVRNDTKTPVEGAAVLVAVLRVLKENCLKDLPMEHFIMFVKDLLESEVQIPGREIN
jgi:hypothetical protein